MHIADKITLSWTLVVTMMNGFDEGVRYQVFAGTISSATYDIALHDQPCYFFFCNLSMWFYGYSFAQPYQFN